MLIPRKHQVEAFNFVKPLSQFALFMEMGTGKSLVIVMKTQQLFDEGKIDKLCIICPSYIKYQWLSDNIGPNLERKYTALIYDSYNLTTKAGEYKFNKLCEAPKDTLKVLCINIEAFRSEKIHAYLKRFFKDRNAFIVVDESTCIKNAGSGSYRKDGHLGGKNAPIQTVRVINGFRQMPYKAILTGTPTPNGPVDLWSQFEFLKENYFGIDRYMFERKYEFVIKRVGSDYREKFTAEHFEAIKKWLSKFKSNLDSANDPRPILTEDTIWKIAHYYGLREKDVMLIKKMKEFSPYKNLDKLDAKIAPITFKCRLKECSDMPEKIYETIMVEMSADQKRLYHELKKQFFAEYNGATMEIKNTAAFYIKFRMILSGVFATFEIGDVVITDTSIDVKKFKRIELIKDNPKTKALQDDIECLDSNDSIIIWSNYRETIKHIFNALRTNHSIGMYYGDITKEERAKNDIAFRNKELRIITANPASAGFGLNWQVSHIQYHYDLSYKADYIDQAEGRSMRIGQKNNCLYKSILVKDTIEEKMQSIVKQKIDCMDFFKDKHNLYKFI